VELYGIGHANVTVPIDLAAMLAYMNAPTFAGGPHGGLITMGDNNYYSGPNGTLLGRYDQKWISSVREPIAEDWVIGKARGELPWFGLLKLYATGTAPDYTPRNSQVNLVVCLVLLITVPMTLDISLGLRKRKEQAQSRERERPPPKS
jgi:signal peptidase